MVENLRAFCRDESAATAVEYGLIAGGIAVAIIATIEAIGPKISAAFSSIAAELPGFAAFGP